MRIREAIYGDLPQMLDIYNHVILHTTAVYDYEPHTLDMRRQWWEAKRAQGYPVLVAEDEGRIAGFSSYGPFRAWAAYQFTVENSVYVSDSFRGRGLGKQLLVPLIELAKEKGYHAMIAGIDATNEASLRLHQQLGFQEVALLKEVGWKFDRWLDLKLLQRLL